MPKQRTPPAATAGGAWLRTALVGVVAFALGFAAHLVPNLVPGNVGGTAHDDGVERQRIAVNQLTSPFLECPGVPDTDLALLGTRDSIVGLVAAARQRDPTLVASVYVRDLLNGPWIGINPTERFVPASLLKLPGMFWVLGQAENDPAYLREEVVFPGPAAMTSVDNSSDLPPDQRMQAGRSYSRLDLLERMIARSDNFAKELLMAGVPSVALENMLDALNFGSVVAGEGASVTTAQYASLFRILYNSSFFSRPMSELGLSVLSRNYYPDGLRRSVPAGTVLATKFGLHHGRMADGSTIQLHECGIVYHPDGPYVICVMTRSARAAEAQLAALISQVGGVVYRGQLTDS